MSLAQNLKRIMQTKGVTAYQLSKAAQVPKSNIHSWLQGQSSVNLRQLRAVARVLGVSVSLLAYGEEDPASVEPKEVLEQIFRGDVRVTIERISRIPKKI